jgi:hypothetical protein
MEVKAMNPKDDQTPQSNKIFDVMRPGKTPASPTSRPVVSSSSNVKDFDFADKPADSISEFGNMGNRLDEGVGGHKPGAPDLESADVSSEPRKNMIALDKEAPDSDLSKVQSEFSGVTGDSRHNTDFKPDDYETSVADLDEDEMSNANTDDDEGLGLQDDLFGEQSEEETNAVKDNRQNEKSPQSTNDRRKTKTDNTRQTDSKANKDSRLQNTRAEDDFNNQTDEPNNSVTTGQMIVSQHSRHPHLWAELFAVLVILALLAGIVNLLLDAGLITLEGVPHTDFFSED